LNLETFKSCAVSSVTAAVISAVISLLAPSGNMEKTIKIIVVLFLLASFAVPFAQSEVVADFFDSNKGIKEIIDENKIDNKVKKEVKDSLENAVETEISAYLSGVDIAFVSVDAKVSVDYEMNISLESITVVLPNEIPTYDLEVFVSERFGLMPDVKFESEE